MEPNQSAESVAQMMADQPAPFDRLTPRELAVVVRIAEGDRNAQIAKVLGCSSKTIDTHRANALKKLNLRHNVDLTREAIRVGLVVLAPPWPPARGVCVGDRVNLAGDVYVCVAARALSSASESGAEIAIHGEYAQEQR